MEYIELGPVPAGEPCAQVGTDNYLARSMRECEVFRRMLDRVFPIPDGLPVKYVVRSHPHDFGTYREVSVRYSGDDPAACNFAFQVESSVPDGWDPVAQQELSDLQRRQAELQACSAAAATDAPADRAHPGCVPLRVPADVRHDEWQSPVTT
jgi:hypothetical protein